MSDAGGESHKRSKAAIAKSLLHRDKSKHGLAIEAEGSSVAGSDTNSGPPSPIFDGASSHRAFGTLRSKQKRSNAALAESARASAAAGTESVNVTTTPSSPPLPQDAKPTIQQSVRVFKLFEVLRSGDAGAIEKAVVETSTSGTNNLDGTSILHLAIQCADPPVVEQILAVAKKNPAVKIDTSARDRDGNTPLHLAAMLGRPTTVRLLLDQPDINDSTTNYQGKSALDLARTPDIFQQLQLSRSLFVDAKVKDIQGLVAKQQYDRLEKVLEDSRVTSALDVNGVELATDAITIQTGGTLLHEAARTRDTHLIQLLLMHGADPFRRDRKGKLPQDVTKDDRTRAILKKSPAAAAAQRGIQEKSILGASTSPSTDGTPGGKDAREMKGYLKKWTNYTSGYKLRWFVLEDGVMSYYKHQDDAGSACRGAINMRIAKLHMDPQDKSRFEIHGKSSVKYHLKANHVVEAKRWFWALNNAIQWAKDEAKQQERQKQQKAEALRPGNLELRPAGQKNLAPPGTPLGPASSRQSFQESIVSGNFVLGDEDGSALDSQEPSLVGNSEYLRANTKDAARRNGGDPEDDDDYGDDVSSHEVQPASKDAFNITAHSASLQLNLLAQVSSALRAESQKETAVPVSDPTIVQALSTYEAAVASLQGLVNDLLKISRDRDAYWQYRLDREVDMRRLWEDSMAKVAREQEELQGRVEESEEKRKRTKRALKDALEGQQAEGGADEPDGDGPGLGIDTAPVSVPARRKSISAKDVARRKSTIADLTNLSDSDSEEDEEFFDAVDAGEVEVVNARPEIMQPASSTNDVEESEMTLSEREARRKDIEPSFHGYEDPVRERLKLDADDRPKISLWGILKSMIGKDMTKMTLPVSFNEPTSLLQRVTEDMEYAELLDTAADRQDSMERMVYVAAFAASEYASTVGRIAKPFNPLLGETYEYVRPDKGYRFFVEQVSHHPPVGAAFAESTKWEYYGESAIKSKFYGKSFDINLLGTWFLKIRPAPTPDNPSPAEELYTWKKVTSSVVGIITGNPTVDNYGPMEIRNHTTGEVCNLEFKQRSWKASSAYQVSGRVVGRDGRTRWSIGGRWNDKIYARMTPGFEDSAIGQTISTDIKTSMKGDPSQAFLVWQANRRPANMPFNLTSFVVTFMSLPERLRPWLPPTDTRFRPDQRAMEDGEYDLAAREKNRVEEKQRAKRRERESKGVEHKPRWFKKGRCEITGEEYWVFDRGYWGMREAVGSGEGTWDGVDDIF